MSAFQDIVYDTLSAVKIFWEVEFMGIAYGGIRMTVLKNAKIYHYEDLKQIPDGQGIYLMFEEGQLGKDGLPRVVRVGKAGNLNNRLSTHYSGSVESSAFRRQVQSALSNSNLSATEKDVSDYIRKNITFAIIRIPFILSCDELERTLINILAHNSKDYDASNWLGLKCSNENVQKYKIWNDQNTLERSEDANYTDLVLDKYLEDLFDIGLVRK